MCHLRLVKPVASWHLRRKQVPSAFSITVPTNSVRLDQQRHGEAAFTVFNASGRTLRARAQLVAQPPEAKDWITLNGQPQRDFPIAGTVQYSVGIAIPPTAPPGSYNFHLDIIGEETPDEDFAEGPTVTFEVPEPVIEEKRPFPWWIVGAAAAILVVILGGYFVFFAGDSVPVPDVAGQAFADAVAALQEAGLVVEDETLGEVSESVAVGSVIRTDPAAGETVEKGTAITLFISTVADTPETPVLRPPSDRVTNNNTPTFTGEAEPNSIVKILKDGEEIGSSTATNNGEYSITTNPLPDGQYDITATATYAAGQTSEPSDAVTITIDTTPPTLTFGNPTPAANREGWHNTNVFISFTVSDDLSGVDVTATDSSPLVLTQDGDEVAREVTVTDMAGNKATFSSPVVKIDKTPPSYGNPTRTPAANDDGWNRTDVTVHFPCVDGLSGPVADVVEVTISTDGASQTATAPSEECEDKAGNVAPAPESLGGIDIDKTRPTITVNAIIVALRVFPPIYSYTVVFETTDATPTTLGSGVVKTECRLASQDGFVNCTTGWRTVSSQSSEQVLVRATDKAGNVGLGCHPGRCPIVIPSDRPRDFIQ
jgi:hypothetical protein